MRITLTLLALLPIAASAADESDDAVVETMEESGPQDIVVTATRDRRSAFSTPASITRIDDETIAEVGSKHQADVLNRIAGVYVQRGSGAESLTAIRSPVLAGAGACGSFLVAEDSLPIRPVGFCNLNEMFELNYEQARQIEVLRGPGSAIFGASAVHGVINLLTPSVRSLPDYSVGLEGGSDSFTRVRFSGSHMFSGEDPDAGIGFYGIATHAPGWRDDSEVDEAKLNLLSDLDVGSGHLRLRAAGTVLNQETAGFIQGYDSYKDEDIAKSNPNPEAFRDASSARVSAHYERDNCFSRDCRFELAGIYRRSRMDFIQHFLIGKPYEHNAQTSYMVSSTLGMNFLSNLLEARLTVDAEIADSELTEYQSGPATDGAPAANAIRPAGLHYDYTVDSNTVGTTLAFDWRFAHHWSLAAALRADRTEYDYDNHMVSGNTRDDGTPCPLPGGCLFSRPDDRTDTFDNFAPRISVSWQPGDRSMLYVSGSTGFRPPEMTEVYRLQRQQTDADLDSEELDSLEAGWKFQGGTFSFNAALFAMEKNNVILRESNGYFVSNGRTTHRGIEYDARLRLNPIFTMSIAGTYARHEYAFSRAIEGGETIIDGNEIDTAPQHVGTLGIDARFKQFSANMELFYVGRYFLDAANTATYPGHEVVNLRIGWSPREDLRTSLRIDNLFDTAYADRADYAFGNYRYFPGRGRALFLSVDFATH